MGWTARDIPDLSGKVAVVTGGNGGLGLEVVRELTRKRAQVMIAARDAAKTAAARAAITTEIPDAAVETVPLDLASLDSVVGAAAAILDAHRVVDLLVNIAGVMATSEQRTRDGFEMQLGVNHLGATSRSRRCCGPRSCGATAPA
jgi:NAD(P)-dependent dehydrogenase (short-subunit alcohol dehydrogenase family)